MNYHDQINMKTYILLLAKKYPKYHKRAGEDTNFDLEFLSGNKIHTIRQNFKLWEKRLQSPFILSVREWKGEPYKSKQQILKNISSDKLSYDKILVSSKSIVILRKTLNIVPNKSVCKNDGLTIEDFNDWFKNYPRVESMILIYFNNQRYLTDME